MVEVSAIAADLDELAKKDWREAHALARRAVAEQPADEASAAQLRAVIRAHPPRPRFTTPDPLTGAAAEVRSAAKLLEDGEDEQAEIALRRHLGRVPRDVQAMRLMAKIASASGFADNARKILVRSLEYDPDAAENWVALGTIIHQIASASGQIELLDQAIAALDRAVEIAPGHEGALALKAGILVQVRRLGEADATFAVLLDAHPEASLSWNNYAYLLKSRGNSGEAIAAYRTAIALKPTNSQPWFGLANLKLARFFQFDVDELEEQLSKVDDRARVEMHFALAKAYDGQRRFDQAAEQLKLGNALRLEQHPHDSETVRKGVDKAIARYTTRFFADRSAAGNPSRAPIFIVGLPRSGSTLIEQILASHSQIEGTEELFIVHQIETELLATHSASNLDDLVGDIPLPRLAEIGERYLDLSKHHRTTNRARFTDKNPANWRQVGFIHAILPHAKIIDARRNPLDCCFANYAQHFNWGVNFSYSQATLASQYREYVRLMRHFDEVAPGLVHRVINDDLIEDFEGGVRSLLEYLELPFEEQCLRFYETERAVHTPSSEQVRQPINRRGIGKWRNYEPWLGELQHALGDLLEDWRA